MNKKDLIVPRVGVVVIKDEHLLLTFSKYGDQEFWLLPGGGIEFEENIFECGKREMKEETGLGVNITKFLYLREFIPKNGKDHVIDIIVLGEVVGGELQIGGDPDQNAQVIKGLEFVPFEKLKDLTIYPECLPELIIKEGSNNFAGCPRYLGNC